MSVLTSAATRQLELSRRQDLGAELTHRTSGLSALLHRVRRIALALLQRLQNGCGGAQYSS